MDIKLKNRHRISLILSVLVVLCAALSMVGLYPYFETESDRFREPEYEEQAFLRHLVFGNYVLDMEVNQYESGAAISPFEHFFPKASAMLSSRVDANNGVSDIELGVDEESALSYSITTQDENVINVVAESGISDQRAYLQNLRQQCTREYDSWKQYYGSIRKWLDYQVLDMDGNVLLDRSGGKQMQEEESYVFRAAFRYDQLGNAEVLGVLGENTGKILDLLQSFGDIDPMSDYYEENYQYEADLTLSNPTNRIFVYGMTEQQMLDYREQKGYFQSAYYNSGVVSKVFIGFACAVAVLAMIISCFDVTRAEDSKVLRAPFEVVACVVFWCLMFGVSLTNLVAVTNRGELYSGLLRANFLPAVADMMVRIWNVIWWSVPFASVYWGVLCCRDIFHIGVKRYLRERTLCGGFCGWVKRLWNRAFDGIRNIDLQQDSNRVIFKVVGINFLILTVLCSLWFLGIGALIVYSVILFIIMQKYYKDLSARYKILLDATNQIAEGNLDVEIGEDLGVFEPFKTEIKKIQSGFKVAVDEEVKSQKLKTDLISNMSHDLKTPLTAIITYVSLLKDGNYTPEQQKAYIDVLEQKSMRLKSLIEDLFEISKANSNNVTLNLVDVDIVSLLKEVSFELSDKIEESSIDFRWNLPDEKIVLPLDSQKTYRIFDNLLTNIMKYAMPHTRAYIDMRKDNGYVVISMKNVSASELTFNPNDITERFVRGDQSRNTEGSGLGMAIAKSFIELQNGWMTVETEADLFRVIIRWPIEEENSEEMIF